MSIFLYIPGLLVILFKQGGLIATLRHIATITLTQILLALPFLSGNWRSYLQYAFDLSRVFLYKWTVNWRLVDEETFLSTRWAKGLLIGHVSTLIAFGLSRWCNRDKGVLRVLGRGFRRPTIPAGLAPVNADRRFHFRLLPCT